MGLVVIYGVEGMRRGSARYWSRGFFIGVVVFFLCFVCFGRFMGVGLGYGSDF